MAMLLDKTVLEYVYCISHLNKLIARKIITATSIFAQTTTVGLCRLLIKASKILALAFIMFLAPCSDVYQFSFQKSPSVPFVQLASMSFIPTTCLAQFPFLFDSPYSPHPSLVQVVLRQYKSLFFTKMLF